MGNERVLSEEILQDAKRKADRALKRAERDARKTLDDAKAQGDEVTDKALAVARRRGESMAQAILATVEAEVKRGLLDAREAGLARLFEQALEHLADRRGYDYPAVVAGLAAEAIQAMGADQVVLELPEADRALATDPWLAEVRRRVGRDVTIRVADDPAAIDGGVIVRSADGRLFYDNSFAARLERLRPELRRELAAKLFRNP